MTGRTKILVVDDELIQRESLSGWFKKFGYEVDDADNVNKSMELLDQKDYDLVFLDLRMPDMNGITLLERIKTAYPLTQVVMLTACGSVETAVEAMKLGACDYVTKPVEPGDLVRIVEESLGQKQIVNEPMNSAPPNGSSDFRENLIGVSPCMRQLFSLINQIAKVDSPVLLQGETGTGKELVAKAIHANSERCYQPFIPINCGAFPETLLESELFGYESGAFTGALKAKKGRVEMAHGGTLFLDEVGEIPLKMQIDLLRVLEERTFQRVGGTRDLNVDFRLICATHRDLAKEIERGIFRQDFYYRLNVIEVEIPPLRGRVEDIPELARYFLDKIRAETNKPITGIHRDGLEFLQSYSWPGNVRELENAIERAVVLAKSRYLSKDDFGFLVRHSGQIIPQTLDESEKQHIGNILNLCGWNITKAAGVLDVSRITLRSKIKKYNLRPAAA
ncbi:MAG: sigma-54 dependent transcriptional regulator [Syntrophobacter sp.]